jgi:hypothetical protein
MAATVLHGSFFSGNFYAQSGSPFNQLIPHRFMETEGFAVQGLKLFLRSLLQTRLPISSTAPGSQRTPTTFNLDLGLLPHQGW